MGGGVGGAGGAEAPRPRRPGGRLCCHPSTHPHPPFLLQPLVIRAVPAERGEPAGTYACPVYATEARFRQGVCDVHLRTRVPPTRWTLAGTCMFLDVV